MSLFQTFVDDSSVYVIEETQYCEVSGHYLSNEGEYYDADEGDNAHRHESCYS